MFWLKPHINIFFGKSFVKAFWAYIKHKNICIFDRCMSKTSRIQLQTLWNDHRHQLPNYAQFNTVNRWLTMPSSTSNLSNSNIHPDAFPHKFLCICFEKSVFCELCHIKLFSESMIHTVRITSKFCTTFNQTAKDLDQIWKS